MDNMSLEIGKNIRRLRMAKGITVIGLSIMLRVRTNQVYSWEHGQYSPSAYYLCKLADVLKCSVDELLGRKPKNASNPSSKPCDLGTFGR